MTTITTMPKGMKVKFSENIEGGRWTESNTPSVCRLSKGRINNTWGIDWYVKLKLTGLVVGDAELTKKWNLYPYATASTHTTATATTITTAAEAMATTINFYWYYYCCYYCYYWYYYYYYYC